MVSVGVSASVNWPSSQSYSSLRKISRIAGRSVSNHACGRASAVCTRTRFSSRSWNSTIHCGSPKPLGLVASAPTSGCGTCMPSAWSVPDMVLVPLRPEPTTNAIRRSPVGVSAMAARLRPALRGAELRDPAGPLG